jgi:hypothetical protein
MEYKMEYKMKVNKISINITIPVALTLGMFLCFVPASIGESVKPAPLACERELVLLGKLHGVSTPQSLRKKILEAQKFLTEEAEQLELSRIDRAAIKAGPSQVPALKKRLIVLLEGKCVDKD